MAMHPRMGRMGGNMGGPPMDQQWQPEPGVRGRDMIKCVYSTS